MGLIARLHDQTSHGGQIITGSTDKLSDGLPTAFLGSQVTCPIHNTNSIVSNCSTNVLTDGKPTAVVGSICACGATIITGSTTIEVG